MYEKGWYTIFYTPVYAMGNLVLDGVNAMLSSSNIYAILYMCCSQIVQYLLYDVLNMNMHILFIASRGLFQ